MCSLDGSELQIGDWAWDSLQTHFYKLKRDMD
jgi:hypothetical protein